MKEISWRRGKPPLFLAPMAGITDWAFRLLCQEQGCDAATTEMISAQGFLTAKKQKNTYQLLARRAPFEKPLLVQLFGCDPNWMGEAAHVLSRMPGPKLLQTLLQGLQTGRGLIILLDKQTDPGDVLHLPRQLLIHVVPVLGVFCEEILKIRRIIHNKAVVADRSQMIRQQLDSGGGCLNGYFQPHHMATSFQKVCFYFT